MDIYEEVTRRIVEQLEQGEIPWRKPWIAGGSCVSYATGKPYSLLNQMLLGKPGEYLTFRQCQQAGGHIHRGEKAHMVVFWKWIEQENEETGEKKEIPFLRYYSIFHINQCEEIAARHAKPLPQTADTDAVIWDERHYGLTVTMVGSTTALTFRQINPCFRFIVIIWALILHPMRKQ